MPDQAFTRIPVCYFKALSSSRQDCSQRRQASAQTRQCAWCGACRSHSLPQLWQMATQASSSGLVTPGSYSATVITDSQADWSDAGQQGANSWIYGYSDKSNDPDGTYQAEGVPVGPNSRRSPS